MCARGSCTVSIRNTLHIAIHTNDNVCFDYHEQVCVQCICMIPLYIYEMSALFYVYKYKQLNNIMGDLRKCITVVITAHKIHKN